MKLYAVTCEYIKGEKQFYYRAQNFYKDVPPSEEGMMGDFVEISEIDLEGSRQFLKKFVVCILIFFICIHLQYVLSLKHSQCAEVAYVQIRTSSG